MGVCIYIYIYMCVCVYVCINIPTMMKSSVCLFFAREGGGGVGIQNPKISTPYEQSRSQGHQAIPEPPWGLGVMRV